MNDNRLPAQSIEAENAIMGICMLRQDAFAEVSEFLQKDSFYLPKNKTLFEVFTELNSEGISIDVVTVFNKIIELGKLQEFDNNAFSIMKLTNDVNFGSPLEDYCKIVLEKYILRQCSNVSSELLEKSFNPSTDPLELISEYEKAVFKLSNILHFTGYESAAVLAKRHKERTEFIMSQPNSGKITGISSGFKGLDKKTFGWQPTDLIILAARPSVGKTAFALNLAKGALENNEGVGLFSLEMSNDQIASRMIADVSQINLERVQRGTLASYEWEQYLKGKAIFERYNLQVDDTAAITIQHLRSKARQMVKRQNVKLIIIDYLQLMGVDAKKNDSREQEVSKISRSLKQLAKELKVPIIALSQLSRGVELRKDSKEPRLSDLRDSGAIEQDADVVMFMYRPEYYDIKQNESGESTSGETWINFAKNRNGSLFKLPFKAVFSTQTFYETNIEEFNQPIMPKDEDRKHPYGNFKKIDHTPHNDIFNEDFEEKGF
jgi:replicative DNA helicase